MNQKQYCTLFHFILQRYSMIGICSFISNKWKLILCKEISMIEKNNLETKKLWTSFNWNKKLNWSIIRNKKKVTANSILCFRCIRVNKKFGIFALHYDMVFCFTSTSFKCTEYENRKWKIVKIHILKDNAHWNLNTLCQML